MRRWIGTLIISFMAVALLAPGALAAAPGAEGLLTAAAQGAPVLSGVVTDDLGQPVAGAEVEVHRTGLGLVAVLQTTPDGRFALPGSARGSGQGGLWRLRINAPSFRVAETAWFDAASARYQTVRLARLTGGVQVDLRDGEGNRLSGTALLIGPGGRLAGDLASGAARTGLLAGTYRALLMAPGHHSVERQVRVEAGRTAVVTARLEEAGLTLSGQMRDGQTGDPVVGGWVELLAADGAVFAAGTTISGGRFSLTLPRAEAGSYQLRATAPGYRAAQAVIGSLSGGKAYDFSGTDGLVMQPLTGTIVGRLLSASGYALRETKITLHREGYGEVAVTTTDDQGAFALTDLPAAPGLRYRITADEAWEPTDSGWVEVLAGTTLDLVLQGRASKGVSSGQGSIGGLVTDLHGSPLAGATVELLRGPRVIEETTTAPNGLFRFDEAAATRDGWQQAEPYTLRISRDGYFTTREVTVGGQNVMSVDVTDRGHTLVRAKLRPVHADLRGRVLDGDGRPVSDAVVELLADSYASVQTVRTDAAGWYVLTDVAPRPAGTYALRVKGTGFRPVSGVDVTEAIGQARGLPTVRLQDRSASLTGLVRSMDGLPLGEVRLMLRGAGGQVLAEAVTDEAGVYHMAVGVGTDETMTLIGSRDGYAQAAAVIAGAAPSGDLVLVPQTATIEGQVLSDLGTGVGGVRVELIQEGRGVVRTVDAYGSGYYRIENVALDGSGWFWLRAVAPERTFAGSLTHGTEFFPLLRVVPGRTQVIDLRVR